jgi:hypothetical protein
MVRNTYIYPPGPSLRIISDIMGYTSQFVSCRPPLVHLRLKKRRCFLGGSSADVYHGVQPRCPSSTRSPSAATTCRCRMLSTCTFDAGFIRNYTGLVASRPTPPAGRLTLLRSASQEAGAPAHLELGYTIADGIECAPPPHPAIHPRVQSRLASTETQPMAANRGTSQRMQLAERRSATRADRWPRGSNGD